MLPPLLNLLLLTNLTPRRNINSETLGIIYSLQAMSLNYHFSKGRAKTSNAMVRNFQSPHNPFSYHSDKAKELRKELFPSWRMIPGRKFKYFMLFGLALNGFANAKYLEIKEHFDRRNMDIGWYYRKAVPFLQSTSDLRVVGYFRREDLIKQNLYRDNTEDW